MRKIILAVGFISIFMFGAQEALCQCECAPIPGSVRFPIHKAFKTSDIVFTGKIVAVKKAASPDEYQVEFKIKSVWKVDIGESVVLRTFRASCGFHGEEGEEFLVYAYVQGEMLTTNGCTRTKLLSKADADLKEFEEKGEQPIKIYAAKSSEQ